MGTTAKMQCRPVKRTMSCSFAACARGKKGNKLAMYHILNRYLTLTELEDSEDEGLEVFTRVHSMVQKMCFDDGGKVRTKVMGHNGKACGPGMHRRRS